MVYTLSVISEDIMKFISYVILVFIGKVTEKSAANDLVTETDQEVCPIIWVQNIFCFITQVSFYEILRGFGQFSFQDQTEVYVNQP